ncbi:serine/threonine protein phosphatase PP1 isozyme [Entamoeba marina]
MELEEVPHLTTQQLDAIIYSYLNQQPPTITEVIGRDVLVQLCTDFIEIVSQEPTLIRVEAPQYVVGDVHGNYFHLLKFFSKTNLANDKYVFLGDYIDRGPYGIDILSLLFALKIRYPQRFVLLRGNHESKDVTIHIQEDLSFYYQCVNRFNEFTADVVMNTLCYLPIACVISNNFLCVHAGIGPELNSLQQIENIQRPLYDISEGIIVDILWSDPFPPPSLNNDVFNINKFPTGFKENSQRNVSYFYGYDVVQQFLQRNNLRSIIRGHETKIGCPFYPLETVINVFSSPIIVDDKDISRLLLIKSNMSCEYIGI